MWGLANSSPGNLKQLAACHTSVWLGAGKHGLMAHNLCVKPHMCLIYETASLDLMFYSHCLQILSF